MVDLIEDALAFAKDRVESGKWPKDFDYDAYIKDILSKVKSPGGEMRRNATDLKSVTHVVNTAGSNPALGTNKEQS